jgi:hypothetical protein
MIAAIMIGLVVAALVASFMDNGSDWMYRRR